MIIGAFDVRTATHVYRLGPFLLDPDSRRLKRGDEFIWLPDRPMDVLLCLVTKAGRLMSHNEIIEAAWRGVAVDNNSLAQAITTLRAALGNQEDGKPYIENVPRQGYRFVATVTRGLSQASNSAIGALMAPHRRFTDGRALLERLHRDTLPGAREAFETVLEADNDNAAAHIGMVNACVLAFESTRADMAPDLTALRQALIHAREAVRLDCSSGEAWATLAFVFGRSGDTASAIAAAREATGREVDDWRHRVRYAYVSWGEERLRAARRVLELCPGLALAHWLAATVFVARQAWAAAIRELGEGCGAQDVQRNEIGRFNAVGLHLLHGLVLAARDQLDAAVDALARELELLDEGHVYGRECGANTSYVIGAIRCRQGRLHEAESSFRDALIRVPGHALATIGLAALSGVLPAGRERDDVSIVELTMAQAVVFALQGKHGAAARIVGEALVQAEPGSAGWLLPVEPLLHATAHADAWAQAIATLRDRAV